MKEKIHNKQIFNSKLLLFLMFFSTWPPNISFAKLMRASDVQRTSNEVICDSNMNRTALVVIDMQHEFMTRTGNDKDPTNLKKTEAVLAAQVESIKKAISYNIPIIFIEYANSNEGTISVLKEEVKNYKSVKFFEKSSDGMFDAHNRNKKDLTQYLKQNNIGNCNNYRS